ncbi:hypothetical protein PQ465_19660 [Sphingobacterium oryzagri]|uniref:3-hydroxymyristoyl/3-hydroxydecanoyl-(Acyl carrier protein) dehydratase n=1 Tax=Sphingobacterium oryzagri TaxID=3025669 RepID=A0ABY7WIS7_9SPHI|nr:hypothetical protein [Sphingobacterium sp. KACC 22765]WDF68499.1 hypothetical protein PQ465_19660 [Sphingobacterium sp. KACC 22765]
MEFPITGAKLLSLIPQRPPMVLVSSLEAYTEDELTASLLITADTLFVDAEGLAESGLLEHMAQAVALHTGYGFFMRRQTAPTGYIGAMQAVEITALPAVGQRIFSDIRILQEFMGVTLVEIITKLEGKIIAKAQMKTVIATK